MAVTASPDFHFTKALDAGPVHCSVWLCGCRAAARLQDRSSTRPLLIEERAILAIIFHAYRFVLLQ